MILISGVIDIAPGKGEQAVSTAREMMAETSAEDGCITYRFYADIEVDNRFRVFEEWESDEALQAHLASPHMARFQEQIAGLLAAPPQITRYQIADHGPLGTGK